MCYLAALEHCPKPDSEIYAFVGHIILDDHKLFNY